MTALDIAIIVFYLLFISWKGFSTAHTYHTTDDYFLANRSLTWPLIGLSLYATNISTSSIIGLGGSGYETGISVFNYEWTGSVMLVIFAIFIVPYYLRNRLSTMPEYLERRFDSRSRYYFSIISITINVLIDTAGALYASSLFLSGIFPDVNLHFFVIAMAVITGLYTVTGGLRAVVITDAIQAVLLTCSTILISGIIFWKFGSWQEIKSSIDPDFLSLIRPLNDDLTPWPTLIISLPILGFYFMCSNQYIVQRVLGARSIEDGRKGAIFAGFLKLPLLFILVLPGTVGRIIYPELPNPNLLFPQLMYDFLPAGILGLVLTGFIAALMSSIDSALTASSSIATMDIYKKLRPDSSERHLITAGKIFILVAVLLASLWAPFISRFPTLWEYLQAVLSYLTPPVVTCFIFGLFWKKAGANGAFYALILGSIFALLMVLNNYFFPVIGPVHYLYSATIIFVFSSVVMVIVSLFSQSGAPSLEKITYLKLDKAYLAGLESSKRWYSSYKFFAALLLILTSLLVWAFR